MRYTQLEYICETDIDSNLGVAYPEAQWRIPLHHLQATALYEEISSSGR